MSVILEKSSPASKRETVLTMKREGKQEREIAAAVGMSVAWVSLHWSRMRREDPRAAAVPPGRPGGPAKGAGTNKVTTPKGPAAWDFSGENLDLPGGEGAW